MNKILKNRNNLVFPTNVRVFQINSDGSLVRDFSVKNRVLKTFGLYSYIRFILGSFSNGSLVDKQQYVPKYLAVGSNKDGLTGAPGTETATQVTDISLYHELTDEKLLSEGKKRIKLNRANYIEDEEEGSYIKIQYEAYIPEDIYVGQTIGEMALMTMSEGWNAYARITGFEPFIKEAGTVIQVIWEISIVSVESTSKFAPVIKNPLKEAVDKAIDILCQYTEDPIDSSGKIYTGARSALNNLIQPVTNLGTGLYYLLNDNETITQDVINEYLSKPFININNTGLIPLMELFTK